MSQSAERVKDPGPRSVSDNDGDSPALRSTTTMAGAIFLAGLRRRRLPGEMPS